MHKQQQKVKKKLLKTLLKKYVTLIKDASITNNKALIEEANNTNTSIISMLSETSE